MTTTKQKIIKFFSDYNIKHLYSRSEIRTGDIVVLKEVGNGENLVEGSSKPPTYMVDFCSSNYLSLTSTDPNIANNEVMVGNHIEYQNIRDLNEFKEITSKLKVVETRLPFYEVCNAITSMADYLDGQAEDICLKLRSEWYFYDKEKMDLRDNIDNVDIYNLLEQTVNIYLYNKYGETL